MVGQSIESACKVNSVPDTYVVQSGDTLTGIASRYDLGMDYVANLNGIERSSGLRVGQKLKFTGDESTKVESKNESKAVSRAIK